jgi:membrane protein involved in colicin uptake
MGSSKKKRAKKKAREAQARAAEAQAKARARAEKERKRKEHEAYLARTTIRRGYRVDKSAGSGSRRKRGTGGGFVRPETSTTGEGLTTKKKVLLGAL